MEKVMVIILIVTLCLMGAVTSVNPSGGLINRLLSQRDTLIQEGLSYFNSSQSNSQTRTSHTLDGLKNSTEGHEMRCLINIENWTQWLLGSPVYYFKHGTYQSGFHEREVFPSHREIIIAVNDPESSFTGTSGIIAWEVEKQAGIHLLIMWSVPYNLALFNAYMGVGVVQLVAHSTQDMMPYYYGEMIKQDQGRVFQRGKAGTNLLFRHEKFFVVANMEEGYQPLLNISVMPWSTRDLDHSIWHQLYVDSLRTELKSQPYSSGGRGSSSPSLMLAMVSIFITLFARNCHSS